MLQPQLSVSSYFNCRHSWRYIGHFFFRHLIQKQSSSSKTEPNHGKRSIMKEFLEQMIVMQCVHQLQPITLMLHTRSNTCFVYLLDMGQIRAGSSCCQRLVKDSTDGEGFNKWSRIQRVTKGWTCGQSILWKLENENDAL